MRMARLERKELEGVRNGVLFLMREDVKMMDEMREIHFFLENMWLLFITMLQVRCYKESSHYLTCVVILILLFLIGKLTIVKLVSFYQSHHYALDEIRQDLFFQSLLREKSFRIPSEKDFERLLRNALTLTQESGQTLIAIIYITWLFE